MRIVNVEQGSPEWHQARAGIPTASQLTRIITKTGKLSDSANKYISELIAESAFGVDTEDTASTFWMERGIDMEPEAVAYYEFQKDVKVDRVGFVLHDDLPVGCSPDFLVGEPGGGEIKCPAPKTHIGYLLGHDDDAYRVQVQSSLWITGREWWDRIFYGPDLPKVIRRFERDEAFIAKIDEAVRAFVDKLLEARAKIESMGRKLAPIGQTDHAPASRETVVAAVDGEGEFRDVPW